MATHGLFVGIDRYASPHATWLRCAKRDATALHALFTDTLGPGAVLLTDQQATRSSIEGHLNKLAQCSPGDVVVISFSCHGTSTHELATYDADPGDLPNTAIPLSLLGTWFSRIPARRLLCIIDSCFSGGIGAKVFIPATAVKSENTAGNPLDRLTGEGRVVLSATTPTEGAWETGDHGLLTFYLLEALQGVEEVKDAGKIAIYRVLDYVTRRVIDRSKLLGKSQHPTVRGHFDGELKWPVFQAGPTYRAAFPERSVKPVSSDILSLEPYGFPPDLLHAWAGSISGLNQLQIDAINDFGLLRGDHLVVSAPTSSGKTMVGELASLRGALERKRAFFLLPLKALVNDKHRHFIKTYQAFGLRVIRATGEVADDIPTLMRGQYDLCLMTYEKFASLAIGCPHILEQVGTVVIDEVQMIADQSRGANLEFVLTLLRMRRRIGIEPQLIALSAVIGDTNGLERWLGARLLRRTDRPVPLDEGILLADGRFRFLDSSGSEQIIGPVINREYRKDSSQDWIIPLVRKLVAENKQVIVFRETKGEARGCALYLADALRLPAAQLALHSLPENDPSLASTALREALRHGVAFHNSDLDRDERLIIEKQFRTPGTALRVITATTTLAMGVNTPAEAVVIAGLEHPGNQPYSIAEYKNIVGRAGRLGFAAHGTSYLLALDLNQEHYTWNRYITGLPEDLHSRFIADDTDPRTLILRVLATGRRAKVKGVPSQDILDFLEGSFGAFQRKQTTANWSWDRTRLTEALTDLTNHKLVQVADDDCYHLTALGRFAGEGGVEVDSIIRLVEALSPLTAASINDPTLIAVTQLTVELDHVYLPMNRRSTQKEPQTWFGELRKQNIPSLVLNLLNRFTDEQHTGTLRAKKASACLLWITDRPMSEIEKVLTQFGGAFDGAAGPVRSVASRTSDLLPSVARVAAILHPDIDLTKRVTRLLSRLEVGVPAAAVEIAQYAGSRLSRGDYQQLIKANLGTAASAANASDSDLLACLGGDVQRAATVRDAAYMFLNEERDLISPILPEYEG